MKAKEIEEIIECLPKGKTRFYYFKDRYALLLLAYFVGEWKKKSQIKESAYAKLLNKEIVRDVISKSGSGVINSNALQAYWPKEKECYLLTLGQWGSGHRSYDQTSRKGHNLVLQLNFSSKHNRPYYEFLQPEKKHPFVYENHPIAREGYLTLAWARIDMEMKDGEALIEEIQNDWIRLALYGKTTIEEYDRSNERRRRIIQRRFEATNMNSRTINAYITDILQPHMVLWAEAMLTATIWFLIEEIGIKRVFYHTYRSGVELKRIKWKAPPKSVYTTLPRKFCFRETTEMPNFLLRHKKKKRNRVKSGIYRFQLLDVAS